MQRDEKKVYKNEKRERVLYKYCSSVILEKNTGSCFVVFPWPVSSPRVRGYRGKINRKKFGYHRVCGRPTSTTVPGATSVTTQTANAVGPLSSFRPQATTMAVDARAEVFNFLLLAPNDDLTSAPLTFLTSAPRERASSIRRRRTDDDDEEEQQGDDGGDADLRELFGRPGVQDEVLFTLYLVLRRPSGVFSASGEGDNRQEEV